VISENSDNGEFTIQEMIELERVGIEAVIDTLGDDCEPLFLQVRDRLTILLNQLARNEILAEYAEVQLEQMQDIQKQWLRDHPIPPN